MANKSYSDLSKHKSELASINKQLRKILEENTMDNKAPFYDTLLRIRSTKIASDSEVYMIKDQLRKYRVIPVPHYDDKRQDYVDLFRLLRLSATPQISIHEKQNLREIKFDLLAFGPAQFECSLTLNHKENTFKRFRILNFSKSCFISTLEEKELLPLMIEYFEVPEKETSIENLLLDGKKAVLIMKKTRNFSIWLSCLENYTKMHAKRVYVILRSYLYAQQNYNENNSKEDLLSYTSSWMQRLFRDCLLALRAIAANYDDPQEEKKVLEISSDKKQYLLLKLFLEKVSLLNDDNFDKVMCDAVRKIAKPKDLVTLNNTIPYITLLDCFRGYNTMVLGIEPRVTIKWDLVFDFSKSPILLKTASRRNYETSIKVAEPENKLLVTFDKNNQIIGLIDGGRSLLQLVSYFGLLNGMERFIDDLWG